MALVPTTHQARLLLADDHAVYRLGLRALLAQQEDFVVVSEASTGEEALGKTLETQPNVVVMDVRLPDISGIESTRQIIERAPSTAIVILSVGDDEEQVMRAMEAGATAYVSKTDSAETIVEAVRSAAEGKVYLPPTITKKLFDHISRAATSARAPDARSQKDLSDRELLILRLLAEGKRNREVAKSLGISERTVGNHIANIYSKLHISDRAQAVLYAVRQGLVHL
jgi:DNA-binding NarL/FixJ family response regulator